MIESLSGILQSKDSPSQNALAKHAPPHIVVDVHGVGYGLDVPASTYERLPEVGEAVRLHTYYYVREDEVQLFGFATPEERAVFEIFINTSGVGPKTSLGILSSIPIGEFARAVMENDLRALMQIPGVGRKTAERLVVELRDKMKAFLLGIEARGAQLERRSPTMEDAIAALLQLGTRPAVAARAVARAAEILGDNAASEDLLREALKHR